MRSRWRGAVLTLIGGIFGAYISGVSNENLAQLEFESSLILQAIDTENRDEAIRNLRFFILAGFIADKDGKFADLGISQLPSNTAPTLNDIFFSTGINGSNSVCDRRTNNRVLHGHRHK